MLITGNYPPQQCGVGDYSYRLVESLRKKSVAIDVVTSQSATTGEQVDESSAHVIRLRNFKNYPAILRLLKERAVNIVHIQFHAFAFREHSLVILLPLLLQLRGIKVVTTVHELAGPKVIFLPRMVRRFLLLPLLLWSHKIIVTNEYYLRLLSRFFFFRRKLCYIPIAPNICVYPDIDRAMVRASHGIKNEEIAVVRFGFVHNIVASFIPQILHALKIIKEKGYLVRLFFMGGVTSPDACSVRKLAKDLGIASLVTLSEYCSERDISSFLSSADIAVQLYPEGAQEGRTGLMTVMAHGLATVCMKKRPPPQLFKHNENIVLISHPVPENIAEAIEQLIRNPDLKARIGREARVSLEPFTWDAVANQTRAAYESLIGP
ncbi:MAG: glycosyltransferase family 4 protein [Candidatus Omnitrophica bacterium]|nr:glycosyltransferase family 4 protein [Candidatus Omnitrophota bacterium]